MEIKAQTLIPIGINQDLGNQVFPQDKLFDAFNVDFIASNNNTTYVIQNEIGNVECTGNITLLGNVVGSCKAGDYIVVFTSTRTSINDVSGIDRIYKLSKDYNINDSTSILVTLIFEGDLNFNTQHPIQSLYSYENANIQKVYWTDGVNQPRYLNIMDIFPITNADKFNFTPLININSTVDVVRYFNGGQFNSGIIQYAISYFYNHGAETTIVDVSPLVAISYKDRAGAVNEMISCSFSLTINNVSTEFDYLRIYAIERSSLDMTPICRKIDLKIKDAIIDNSITILDTGRIGTTIDAAELLYVGGEDILLGTITTKDNTFFGGNITINRASLLTVKSLMPQYLPVTWYSSSQALTLEQESKNSTVYGYKPLSLSEVDSGRRYFKNNEWYRFGFRAQHKTGKWSEVLYIGADSMCNVPITMNTDLDNPKVEFFPTYGKFTLPTSVVVQLKSLDYVAVQPVFVFPTSNDRNIVAQGLLTNTISSEIDMPNIEAYSDYLLRTNIYFGTHESTVNTNYLSIDDTSELVHFNQSHYTPLWTTSRYSPNITDKQFRLYEVNMNEDELYNYTSPIDLQSITQQTKFRELDINTDTLFYKFTDSGFIRTVYLDKVPGSNKQEFFVNQNVVDFWSPIFEYDSSSNTLFNNTTYLRIVGITPITSNSYSSQILLNSNINDMKFSPIINKESFRKLFNDYSESLLDLTTSKGINRVVDTVAVSVSGGGSSSLSGLESIFLPMWSRHIIMDRPESDTYSGRLTISRKSAGRFHYSSFNRYFTRGYTWYLSVNTPTFCSYEQNTSMLNSINITDTSSNYVSSGMNKLFTNLSDVTKLTTIRYKTANHVTFSFKDVLFGGNIYKETLPDLVSPSSNILTQLYTKIFDTGNNYIKNTIVSNTKIEPNTFVFADNSVPNDYETFCYLGELVQDKLGVMYGGQKSITVGSEELGNLQTLFVATDISLQNNVWIPCGNKVILPQESTTVDVICDRGDTYLQRYDLLKTSPILEESSPGIFTVSSLDYQLNSTVVSFLVESPINLDGRSDKDRYNTKVLNATSNTYNKINTVYSQTDNLFSGRTLNYEEFNIDKFINTFTWSKPKLLGESVDSYTGLDLINIYDCDGKLGKITGFKPLGMYLIGFQENGIFNILHNVRTAITADDNAPIELGFTPGISGIRYITTTTGITNALASATSAKGIYFIDSNNKYIGRYNDEGIVNLTELKGMKSWAYKNINANVFNTFYNSSAYNIFIDQLLGRIYFVNKDYCLIYSETYEVFLGFYSYNNIANLFNIWGELYSLSSDSKLFLQYKGKYNHFFNTYKDSYVTFKFNPESLIDKTFNNIEMGYDAFFVYPEMKRLLENSTLRLMEIQDNNDGTPRLNENSDIRFTEDERMRILEYIASIDPDYRVLENSDDVYMPNIFLSNLTVKNEFQRNSVPLVKGYLGNCDKKFRKWRITIPREQNSIDRFRGLWLDATFKFIPDQSNNIKFNLYDTSILYTIH